jgi:hypothetical protein
MTGAILGLRRAGGCTGRPCPGRRSRRRPLSGQYLVFAVGSPAVAALYFDVCGWSNPSARPAGSTPFYYYVGPLNTLPGADAFVNSGGDTAADTQALTTDNAYYALTGQLPAGVTSLPAAVGPPYACVGSPS